MNKAQNLSWNYYMDNNFQGYVSTYIVSWCNISHLMGIAFIWELSKKTTLCWCFTGFRFRT